MLLKNHYHNMQRYDSIKVRGNQTIQSCHFCYTLVRLSSTARDGCSVQIHFAIYWHTKKIFGFKVKDKKLLTNKSRGYCYLNFHQHNAPCYIKLHLPAHCTHSQWLLASSAWEKRHLKLPKRNPKAQFHPCELMVSSLTFFRPEIYCRRYKKCMMMVHGVV